jgi:hypothetical protein
MNLIVILTIFIQFHLEMDPTNAAAFWNNFFWPFLFYFS